MRNNINLKPNGKLDTVPKGAFDGELAVLLICIKNSVYELDEYDWPSEVLCRIECDEEVIENAKEAFLKSSYETFDDWCRKSYEDYKLTLQRPPNSSVQLIYSNNNVPKLMIKTLIDLAEEYGS
tara:strand:- start:205392 stop:205763 length:372 start_codon:yes stop_codon:yes gene_type:complete